jgi:hypothetical protein
MTASLFPLLNAFYPACAAFGPFMLVMGIHFRTSGLRKKHPKFTKALLLAGGFMITLCLLLLAPMGIPSPK